MEVVSLKKYCEISGDTPSAVRSRVQRGTWLRGLHVLKIEGIKELYVDTTAIAEWMRDPKNHVH